ncbi:MAG: cytochrome-c oxidase, cbb3-type subunit III [Xanthobacteraceae bacterium]|nr:cytochrome-c oxidase, cbb3-type subunit III [Xanthobacteraceae bacterium]
MGGEKKARNNSEKALTTGHEWDGIEELNTPLPKWWIWIFYATIVWSIGYWVVYPSWPLVSTYASGAFNWRSRSAVQKELELLQKLRAPLIEALRAAPVEKILADPQLLNLARAQGRVVFRDNCAACHGIGATGIKGYPNLNDDDWLWGGKPQDIIYTITYGVRSAHPKAHSGVMPAFGRGNLLKMPEIIAVAEYVRTLSGLTPPAGTDLALGGKVFKEHCAVCHAENGKGRRDIGSPDLTDSIWLYGSDQKTIVDGIYHGRGGMMPAWIDRLDEVTIKALAAYIHSLGGGK